MNSKPIIGVSMRVEIETNRFYLGRDYTEAIEGLGGIPFHISLIPNQNYIAEILRIVDGVLLPGSDTDVDPLIFGEEPKPRLKRIVPEKDRVDLMILEEAEKLAKPVLGICYGMQVLNVSRGGTLHQDIESEIERPLKHEQGAPLGRNSHSLEIAGGSFLSNLTGDESIKVNSHHHQSVKSVGRDLKPTAWAADRVVECIEDTRAGRFVVGVQWHPELSWKTDAVSRKIFESFLIACQN